MEQQTILLVDDEDYLRERLAKAFAKRGYRALTAGSYEEAMPAIERERPALAVFDLKMPGKSGLALLRDALAVHPAMKVVVLTGYGSISTATDAVKLGALNYLPKPADADDILAAFAREVEIDIDTHEDGITPPSLARAEWEHINRVLTDCEGNISAAAKRLNIHRRTLQRKLMKYPPKQ